MLGRVEEASRRITARRLPACDRGASLLVELSVDLCVEPDTGQPALHVATLALVKTDLIFCFLCFFYLCRLVFQRRRFDRSRDVAGCCAQTSFGRIRTDETTAQQHCQYPEAHGLYSPP